jgi:ribosomal protein S18 acetylase RimI-like enzyme
MQDAYELHKLTGDELGARADEFFELYRAAFAEPPWDETSDQAAKFPARLAFQLRTYPGVHGMAAQVDGRLAGFIYGWPAGTTFPDTSFYHQLMEAVPVAAHAQLLAPALEVVNLTVSGEHRGKGIGRTLLTEYVNGWPQAWLCTHPEAPARRLYDSAGWEPVGEFVSDGKAPRVVYTKAPS